jgi:hypothetical protein
MSLLYSTSFCAFFFDESITKSIVLWLILWLLELVLYLHLFTLVQKFATVFLFDEMRPSAER